jgi:hypothetical protein
MNKQNENTLVMLKALLSFLKLNQAIWQNSQPYQEAVAELERLIAEIEQTQQITELDQSGLSKRKKALKAKLVDLALDLASQIYALASKMQDQVLQKQVKFTKSDLEGQRESELANTSKIFLGLGQTHAVALLAYGIDDAYLASFDELITSYKNSLPDRRLSVTERKTNNEKLKTLFAQAKQLLKNQLNPMTLRFKESYPDFYNGYLNTSKVVDYGVRYEDDKDEDNEKPV